SEDPLVLLPEAAAGHREDLGGGVVAELADGALLDSGEGGLDLEAVDHGEGQRAQDEIAVDPHEAIVLVAIDGGGATAQRVLLQANDLRAQAGLRFEPGREAGGQPVHAPDDLVEALSPYAELLLAQVLGESAAQEHPQ